MTISETEWRSSRNRLEVSGRGTSRKTVTVVNAYDPSQVLGSDEISRRSRSWSIRTYRPSPVPCRVRATQSDGQVAERDVSGAPDNCAPKSAGGGNQAPTANAGPDQTVTIDAGQSNINVTLNGSGSSDPDGTITTYNWTGTPNPANTVNPTVSLTAGTYTFTLVVTDNDGASSAADTVVISVNPASPENLPPTANANGPNSGTTGVAVSFSSAGSDDPDGSIASYAWSFGDGKTSSQADPSHTYTAANSYTVPLTVTDNQGASSLPSTTTASITGDVVGCNPASSNLSINSTSQDGCRARWCLSRPRC